jgi:hypothetical protein
MSAISSDLEEIHSVVLKTRVPEQHEVLQVKVNSK